MQRFSRAAGPVVGLFTLATTTLMVGCGEPAAAPIPARSSPRSSASEAFPSVGQLLATDRDHVGWAFLASNDSGVTGTLELHDAEGVVATRAWSFSDAWMYFDVAPDRSAAFCNATDVTLFADGRGTTTALTTLAPAVRSPRCMGIASRGADDVWVLVTTDPWRGDLTSSASPPALCRHDARGWACFELDGDPDEGTLVLTAAHAWWLSEGSLLALDTSAPNELPVAVRGFLVGGSLQASPIAEAVLLVPSVPSPDGAPSRIALDGSATSFVARSENGGYRDVWLDATEHVLALDVASDGFTHCVDGLLDTGSSCSTHWHWTQLIVLELVAAEPIERAHAEYPSGGQYTFGLERPDGTFASGDQWYRMP